MSPPDNDLLNRILAFEIDGPERVALPFAVRLAREHGWSRRYSERVIAEYKRYVFLATISSEPVCPSEDVDAAWHMHLTYTRNYWKMFCGEVLGAPLHHDPSKGGAAEANKHFTMYERTLETYRAVFGHAPPKDIWPAASQRFGKDLKHRVVNTAHHWVIPKAPVKSILAAMAAGLVVAAFVPGCNGGNLNPFDLVGAEFLAFLIPMMFAAVIVGRVIRSRMREPGPQSDDYDLSLNWEQVAYLSGGYPRLITAAIARLVDSGAASINEAKSKILPVAEASNRNFSITERAVFNALPIEGTSSEMKRLKTHVESEYGPEVEKLEQEGFVLPQSRYAAACLGAVLPLLAVILLFAFPRLIMGLMNHKPVAYLLVTIFLVGAGGMLLSVIGPLRLTKRGEKLIEYLKLKNFGMRTGSGQGEPGAVGMGVALFGIAALTMMTDLRAWFPRKNISESGCGSGCGAGCGGGDGGGGCGGGGCGGCGGGGD